MPQSQGHNLDPDALLARYFETREPDLKDLVLVQHSGMVERIARRFAGVEPLEDLIQVGFIGLLNALSKFDPGAGVRFNTYATHLVAGEIKHYLRDRSQTIRQPAWLQELRHKVQRATALLQAELGRAPLEREVAERIGVSESAVSDVLQTQDLLRLTSLDMPPPQGDDDSGDGDGFDSGALCPQQMGAEDRVVLANAIQQLRELEQKVLMMFHFESLSQTEIAHRMGISCNYVSHILRQSLGKLRRILESETDRVPAGAPIDASSDVVDRATGLYTEAYLRTRLQEESHRAASFESDLGVVVVSFQGLEGLAKNYGSASVRDFVADAGEFVRRSVRRLDVVGRTGKFGFALILTTGSGSATMACERMRAKIDAWLSEYTPNAPGLVAAYAHASFPHETSNPAELLDLALERLSLQRPADYSDVA